nr:uncharacterized protein LOC129267174 [Lytechinus pictus]
MSDAHSGRQYLNNANISITAGESFSITCGANRARPPAVLHWLVPEDVTVVHQDKSDVIQDGSYISRKTLTITPTRVDHEKSLSCIASHPEIQGSLRSSVLLNVHVLPTSVLLFLTGGNQSQSTVLYVQEDLPSSITCKSIGSFLATELSFWLVGDLGRTPIHANVSSYRSVLDETLFDTEIPPARVFVSDTQSGWQYLNNANISITAGDPYIITCGANRARPPAVLQWLIPEDVTVVQQDQSDDIQDGYYTSQKSLTITPTRNDHGKIISCIVSHQDLQRRIRYLVTLNVRVLPTSVLVFSTGGNQSQSTVLYVQEDSPTTITCKSIGSFPATELSFWLVGDLDRTSIRANVSKTGGFWVLINRGEYLPVIGEDITLVCTFTLQTRNRVVMWQKDGESLATCDCQENRSSSPSVIIVTDRSSRLCSDNNTSTVMAGEPNVLTCTASQARPPAVLNWIVPDDLISNQQIQTDVVKGNSYTSRKVVTITPSASDQGKHISCFASHQTLQSDRQCIVFLNVHVLPSSTTIFQSGNDKDYQTSSTVIYVQEGSSASISCQSIGSRPEVQLTWRIDDPDIPPGSISLSNTQNPVDDSLFDTVSTYKLHLYRKYQGLILWCFVYLGEDYVERQFVTISTYAPQDEVVMTFPAELKEGIKVTVMCKAANGYPAPRIYWYIGSRNMTGHSSLNISENDAERCDAESTLTFVPKRSDHGKHLLCLAVLPTLSTTWSVNDSMVLYITGA